MESDNRFQQDIKGLQTEQKLWNNICETWKNILFYILIKHYRGQLKIAIQLFYLKEKEKKTKTHLINGKDTVVCGVPSFYHGKSIT